MQYDAYWFLFDEEPHKPLLRKKRHRMPDYIDPIWRGIDLDAPTAEEGAYMLASQELDANGF